jgi:two-component system response regulator HydG
MWLSDWFRKRNEEKPVPQDRLKILILSMSLDDRLLLEQLAKHHHWSLRFTHSPQEGFNLTSQNHFEVVLCDRNQNGYPWREVIDRLAAISPQSCILLVSPLKEEYLWRDVLQQGGYDVLIRPLCEAAVLRAIDAATRFTTPAMR